jgi:hypothetical protein
MALLEVDDPAESRASDRAIGPARCDHLSGLTPGWDSWIMTHGLADGCRPALVLDSLSLGSDQHGDAGEEAAMIAAPDRDQDRFRLIARHVASEYARDNVAKALYAAVVEGLEFGPRDLPLAEDREWIREAIAAPLQEASDAAIEVLASSVGRALERAPSDLLERYERSHHLQELGIE